MLFFGFSHYDFLLALHKVLEFLCHVKSLNGYGLNCDSVIRYVWHLLEMELNWMVMVLNSSANLFDLYL